MTAVARGHLHDAHGHDHHGHDHNHNHDHDHAGHLHIVPPQATNGNWLEQLGVVLAVGLRPCRARSWCWSSPCRRGCCRRGIAAVFLMGRGHGITVAVLATLAVTAKGLARRIGGIDNPVTGAVVWWAELLGAVAVLAFGVLLLLASL